MSGENNTQPVSEANQTQETANASAATQKAAPTGAPAASSQESFSSLAELREKNPEVYNKMMLGIAQNICIRIKRQEDHLRQLQREYRQRDGN